MRPLPASPVFSRRDARPLGWSDAALSRAVRGGRILRLRRDQFTGVTDDPNCVAIAAVRGCGGSVISVRSATLMHGLPIVGSLPRVPDVTVQPRRTGDVRDAHLYRATLRPQDVVEIDGVPVTSIPRTLIDLGRHRPMTTMVAAADFALHEGLTSVDELREVLAFCRSWPGAARAARALARVDGRAESPLESISRLVFTWLRLPAPELQRSIHAPDGTFVARGDFYWDEFGVLGEADGLTKMRSRSDWLLERERQREVERLHVVVVRWDWPDATRMPRLLATRINAAFDDGRRRDLHGFPRLWSVGRP